MAQHSRSLSMLRRTLFALSLLLLSSGSLWADTVPLDLELERVSAWLSGSFDSRAQASRDPRYFEVSLEVAPIWTARKKGRWLYVEQALCRSLERPYRQRVYHVARAEGGKGFVSTVYEIPQAERFVGAYRHTSRFEALKPKDLIRRPGAKIYLRREGEGYRGGTRGRECKSDFRGASYATAQVRLGPSCVESWDRGFDGQGKQVWGATAGAYRFLRRSASAWELASLLEGRWTSAAGRELRVSTAEVKDAEGRLRAGLRLELTGPQAKVYFLVVAQAGRGALALGIHPLEDLASGQVRVDWSRVWRLHATRKRAELPCYELEPRSKGAPPVLRVEEVGQGGLRSKSEAWRRSPEERR
jgi:CpeT protein